MLGGMKRGPSLALFCRSTVSHDHTSTTDQPTYPDKKAFAVNFLLCQLLTGQALDVYSISDRGESPRYLN